jgi:hypothetical protein
MTAKGILIMFRKVKIFGVGFNKTGTTSLACALESFGFRLGKQNKAELFLTDYSLRQFHRIVKFCKKGDAFQDIPFSLNYTYQVLDYSFPGSKFILTVRNSGEEWYDSLVRHQTKIVGKKRLPTAEDLKKFSYRKTGWLWEYHKIIFGADEATLYDKNRYIKAYRKHNSQVLEYFRYRPEDLLVLNPCDPSAMKRLCDFLEVPYRGQAFPWRNKTN